MEKDRLKLGIKKYGYDSEFIREYNSLMLQLKYDEREKFFDKWKIKTKTKMSKESEEKKINEIFILMKLGKMTLTEVNTLTHKERFYLSQFFYKYHKAEEELIKLNAK